jgi:hypothetical protein
LLKHTLQHEESWQAFTQQAAQSKSQIQQSALAFLAPPHQRTKARYRNLEILVRWGQRALGVLDRLEKRGDHRAGHEKLKAKLGWLRQFRDDLPEWEALLDVAITTECFVRKHGLWRGAEVELSKRLDQGIASARVLQFREQLLAFVRNESLQAACFLFVSCFFLFVRGEKANKTRRIGCGRATDLWLAATDLRLRAYRFMATCYRNMVLSTGTPCCCYRFMVRGSGADLRL